MSESKQTFPAPTKDDVTAAHVAEILLRPSFRSARNKAFEDAEGDGELYLTWRDNADRHIASLASALTLGKGTPSQILWEQQRLVAQSSANGEPIGPFGDFFFGLTHNGRSVEVNPSDGDISHLPPGEYDVVATNNAIMAIARQEEDAFIFFDDALSYLKKRRQQGGSKFEGPENYATTLKLFTDKSIGADFTPKDKKETHALVGECMSRFLTTSERDTPNVVEMTNILSAVKHLPQGSFDKRFSEGILKHTLTTLDDFSQKGLNLLISAVAKLDVSECGEVAAMTVDLALRKGQRSERTGDMLAALRATANLPHSSASERAFRSLLDTRSSLEMASGLDDLETTIKLLKHIISETSESPEDTLRVKGIANFIARKAVETYKQSQTSATATPEELSRSLTQTKHIVDIAKQI